jgi:hypothetical protein
MRQRDYKTTRQQELVLGFGEGRRVLRFKVEG